MPQLTHPGMAAAALYRSSSANFRANLGQVGVNVALKCSRRRQPWRRQSGTDLGLGLAGGGAIGDQPGAFRVDHRRGAVLVELRDRNTLVVDLLVLEPG